ncbi:unnamed protein product [Lathyrus sativus]|nr:unnamed protein product [Lathyrus sativus]
MISAISEDPSRFKALSSSSGDSNGKDLCVSPSKFAKSDELWESYVYLEPPLIQDVQIQQDSELKSSNTSLEDCSSSSCGFTFLDEDNLITYDGPFSTLEVTIPPRVDSCA